MKRYLFLFIGLWGLFPPLGLLSRGMAQDSIQERPRDHFYIDGEVRERALYSHGYSAPMTPDATGVFWVGQRTRLGFGYEHENLGLYIQAEDVRIWGQSGRHADGTGFTISQAYFFMDFGKGFGMKIGRQTIKIEDSRYLHASSWGEATSAHDALRFTFNSSNQKARVELIGSFSNPSTNPILNPYTVNNFYKYLVAVHLSYTFAKDFRWSLLSVTHFNERLYRDTTGRTLTDPKTLYATSALGTYLDICPGRKFSAVISGYGQWGKTSEGKNRTGYVGSIRIKYRPIQQFGLEAVYDYYSKHFDRLFGSTVAHLGIMGYFTAHNGPTGGLCDLHEPYLVLTAYPHKNHTLALNARYFFASEKQITDGSGNFSRDLGAELLLSYKYRVHRDVMLEAGYGWHSNARLLQKMYNLDPGQGRVNQFAYLMIQYKPVLFDNYRSSRK